MMCKLVVFVAVALATVVLQVGGLPAGDDLMFDLGHEDDTAVVESTVRETRQAVPEHIEDLLQPGVKEAFLHTYGDDGKGDGDLQGYRKRTKDQGQDGYKHFDSFHKKDGDKFGYETHSEYGAGNKAKIEAGEKSQKYSAADGDHSGEADDAETKKSYKVVEDVKEGKKGVRNLEDYDGDSGYYADSGDAEGQTDGGSEHYSEGDGEESAGYTEGGDAESENYEEGYDEGDGESGHLTAEDGGDDAGAEAEYEDGDGGEAEAYTAEEESDDDY